jgi:hypothetical protein
MYHPSIGVVGYGTAQTFQAKERYMFMLMAIITEELGEEHGFAEPMSYEDANKCVLAASHDASERGNVPDMSTHVDKSHWPGHDETTAHDAKLRNELGDGNNTYAFVGKNYSVPVESQSAIGAITTVELQSLLQVPGASTKSWKDMYSKSEDVNGYSQVYGPAFRHNPWDRARMVKNVVAIYDELIAGVSEGAGKKLTDKVILAQYAHLLPSGLKHGSFSRLETQENQPSIKRARYIQLCKERNTEVKEAVKEAAAARKRAAQQNTGAGKKRRKVAKPQPEPSSGVTENTLEAERKCTEGGNMPSRCRHEPRVPPTAFSLYSAGRFGSLAELWA